LHPVVTQHQLVVAMNLLSRSIKVSFIWHHGAVFVQTWYELHDCIHSSCNWWLNCLLNAGGRHNVSRSDSATLNLALLNYGIDKWCYRFYVVASVYELRSC
jgi:hypothetical protein